MIGETEMQEFKTIKETKDDTKGALDLDDPVNDGAPAGDANAEHDQGTADQPSTAAQRTPAAEPSTDGAPEPAAHPPLSRDDAEKESQDFLEGLFRPGDLVSVRVLDPDPPVGRNELRSKGVFVQPEPGEEIRAGAPIDVIRDHADRLNVHAGVAARRAIDVKDGKENLRFCRAVWVDLDGVDDVDEAVRRLQGAGATWVIQSGPCGLHAYWLLDERFELEHDPGRVRFERVLKGVCAELGGDPAVAECAHIMRVPGTMNLPNEAKRAKRRVPFQARFVFRAGPRHNFEDLADLYEERGQIVASPGGSSARIPLDYDLPDDLENLSPRVEELIRTDETIRARFERDGRGLDRPNNQSDIDMSLARRLASKGRGPGEVEVAIRISRSRKGGLKEQGDRHFQRTVETAFDHLAPTGAIGAALPVAGSGAPGGPPSAGNPSQGWSAPLPFHGANPEPFPVDSLPPWMRSYVEGLAEQTQTPADLAGCLVLAVLATSLAKKFRVEVKPGHSEPLNLYIAVALPPASRKTAVFSDVRGPIDQHEQAERDRVAPEIRIAEVKRGLVEARLKARTKDASKAKPQERAAIDGEVLKLADELDQIHVPALPRLVTDDVGQEKLACLLADHGERMAVFAPEGSGVFALIRGRYGKGASGPNMGTFLAGHPGDPIIADRIGRKGVRVGQPAVTLAMTMQPEVIEGLAKEREMRALGLLARILYSVPESRVGKRDPNPSPLDPRVRGRYREGVACLLRLDGDSRGIGLTDGARATWMGFSAGLEPRLGVGGDLYAIADWAGKLAGAVARIAGLLHAAKLAPGPAAAHPEASAGAGPADALIDEPTMEEAIAIGRYFLAHAEVALGMMGVDPAVAGAQHLWRIIEARKVARFTKRELHQWARGAGRFQTAQSLDAPLGVLVDHGYLRELHPPAPGARGGRPPSAAFEVNPRAAGART
jgi:hypothetical protein